MARTGGSQGYPCGYPPAIKFIENPEVTNILIGKCTVNPNKATYVALIEIWRTFPDARY